MKNTKIQLMFSIALCLILLGFFGCLDRPNAKQLKKEAQISAMEAKEKKEKFTGEKNDTDDLNIDSDDTSYDQFGTKQLILAVGTTGNLKEKAGEPIYQSPYEDSDIIATLQFHCAVILEEEEVADGWSRISLQDQKGYVKTSGYRRAEITIGDVTNSPARNGIIKDAVSYIGLPFKRYGKSLTTGIDCSNYIQQIYKMNGIIIRNRPNFMKEDSIIIDEKDALPADVVYYYANNGEGHVGIYLGEDQNGTKYIINTAGHAGRNYPEGGCRICEITYMDREEYIFCRLF